MFFSLPNLRASSVVEVAEPWALKTKTPPPYADGKEAVIEFCNKAATEHAMLSMFEGMSADVRVTMEDNPPFRMHGLLVDYDNPLPAEPAEYGERIGLAVHTELPVITRRATAACWEFESRSCSRTRS